MMNNIRIEEVGDINSTFPYLEFFFKEAENPFLEIAISEDKELVFKFYASKTDIQLDLETWDFILSAGKVFLPKALKNEDDFLNFSENI